MKFPKQLEQKFFMGKPCTFTANYYKTFLSKKVRKNKYSYGESVQTPVRWKKTKHDVKAGWIVGFGFCFNGSICKDSDGCKYFASRKRINFVKIKVTPMGKEIKVPASAITHVADMHPSKKLIDNS